MVTQLRCASASVPSVAVGFVTLDLTAIQRLHQNPALPWIRQRTSQPARHETGVPASAATVARGVPAVRLHPAAARRPPLVLRRRRLHPQRYRPTPPARHPACHPAQDLRTARRHRPPLAGARRRHRGQSAVGRSGRGSDEKSCRGGAAYCMDQVLEQS